MAKPSTVAQAMELARWYTAARRASVTALDADGEPNPAAVYEFCVMVSEADYSAAYELLRKDGKHSAVVADLAENAEVCRGLATSPGNFEKLGAAVARLETAMAKDNTRGMGGALVPTDKPDFSNVKSSSSSSSDKPADFSNVRSSSSSTAASPSWEIPDWLPWVAGIALVLYMSDGKRK